MIILSQVVEIFVVVMAKDAGGRGTRVGSVNECRSGEYVVVELNELYVSGSHVIEGLRVGCPANGFHGESSPFKFLLQVGLEVRFASSIADGSGVQEIDGGTADVQLGTVSGDARDLGTVGLKEGLMVDGFMICIYLITSIK
jgi:hypothetical protein